MRKKYQRSPFQSAYTPRRLPKEDIEALEVIHPNASAYEPAGLRRKPARPSREGGGE